LIQILRIHVVTCGVKMMYYVMVEADSHLNLLPPFIFDIYKAFEHFDLLCIGICKQSYTVTPQHYLVWILGFWVTYVESK
jgi:hypothetical protein